MSLYVLASQYRIYALKHGTHIRSLIIRAIGSAWWLVAVALGAVLGAIALILPLTTVVGLVAAIATVSLIVWQPMAGVALLLASLALPVQREVAGMPVAPFDLVTAVLLLVWPAQVIRSRSQERWVVSGLLWPGLALLSVALLSLTISVNTTTSLKQIVRMFEYCVVIPLVLRGQPSDWRSCRWVACWFILPPMLVSADALLQLATGWELSAMVGLDLAAPTDAIDYGFAITKRVSATFGGPNALAEYLSISIALTSGVLLSARSRAMLWLAGSGFVLEAAALVATQSRGGVLAAIFGVVVVMWIRWRRRFLSTLAVVGVAGSLGLLSLQVWTGLSNALANLTDWRQIAVLDRLDIWQMALRIVRDSPVLGIGVGAFRDEALSRGLTLRVPLGYGGLHAHNTFLEVATGMGLLGLVAFGLLLAWGAFLAWHSLTRARSVAATELAAGACGALATYMLYSMFDNLLARSITPLLVIVLTFASPTARNRVSRGLEQSTQ